LQAQSLFKQEGHGSQHKKLTRRGDARERISTVLH